VHDARRVQLSKSLVPPLTVGECAGGHRAENRRKSRDIMIQPRELQQFHFYLFIYLLIFVRTIRMIHLGKIREFDEFYSVNEFCALRNEI